MKCQISHRGLLVASLADYNPEGTSHVAHEIYAPETEFLDLSENKNIITTSVQLCLNRRENTLLTTAVKDTEEPD